MVEINNVRVYNLDEAIISCRNAMRIEPVNPIYILDDEYNLEGTQNAYDWPEGEYENSLKRAIQLAKSPSNSGHTNFLKGILVSYDIKYPQYFTKHLQRYIFNVYVSSSSIMHRLIEQNEGNRYNEYVTDETKNHIQHLISIYNKDKTEDNWLRILSNCPLGLELFVHCTTNYLQLRNIYQQRKNHKLKDWKIFCKFIEELPYFNEFIDIK